MDDETPGSATQGDASPEHSASVGSDAQPTPAEAPLETPAAMPVAKRYDHDLTFSGNGGEYFRIWVVNLALTIVTLGIFSAWAKVRTNRYFYGSTRLAGDTFDYIANPIVILKGRLIAAAAVVIYTLVQYFSETLGLVLFCVLLMSVPFLLVRSMRFNASVTVWRGLRMGFNGSYADAFKTYIAWPLIGILTLGFLIPHSWYKKNQYLIGNYRYGRTLARSSTTSGDFYLIAFMIFGVTIGLMIVWGIVTATLAFLFDGGSAVVLAMLLFYLLAYVLIFVLYQALHYRLIYGHIHVGNARLRSRIKVTTWIWIAVTNSLGILFTLGFFYPWARVRMTRFILSHVYVEASRLDDFGADKIHHHSAAGEELGEAFDMGLGI